MGVGEMSEVTAIKLDMWASMQKRLAAEVCVPNTNGMVELYEEGTECVKAPRDSFLLPHHLVEEFASSAIGPQLERDERRRGRHSPPILRHVGGVDISFIQGGDTAVACLAVMEYPSMKVCRTFVQRCEVKEPYITSYLAFREAGPLVQLIESVRDELFEEAYFPQLLLVDGCGVHHPLRCGLASHLGVVLDIPTVGCAKKFLSIDGITRDSMDARFAEEHTVASRRFEGTYLSSSSGLCEACFVPIIGESGRLWGYAATPNRRVKNPIFISPGNRVGYAEAAALAVSMCKYRVPEPIRAADLHSREFIRRIQLNEC